jgi:hypothetical protein
MLVRAKKLGSFGLHCFDGDIGAVEQFYFDDQFWVVRYLVAKTGGWLKGRQVLISPYALSNVAIDKRQVDVELSKREVENSPPLESDKPVSRQLEEAYCNYYGWPMYWSGQFMWGYYPYVDLSNETWNQPNQGGKALDPHLRSTDSVTGYGIQASDGDIGHVEDFLIDSETWAIRYLIVDTRNWWPGKHVLVSPKWIERVSWTESKVFVNLSREAIKQSPSYVEETTLTRDYETRLHEHYGHQGYWTGEPQSVAPFHGVKHESRSPERSPGQ